MNTRTTKTRLMSLAFVLMSAMLMAPLGCSTAPNTVEGMSELESKANAAAVRIEPTLPMSLNQYAGYAVFPDIGRGAVGIGGAYGKGVVYEHGNVVGYVDMTEGTLGWQLGGETFKEVLVFTDETAFHRFKEGNFEFKAEAKVIASDSAADATAQSLGAHVYLMDKDGLMFAAAVGSQKFEFVPKT